MTPRTQTVVLSNALCDLADAPPEQQQAIGSGLLKALGLVPRYTPGPEFAATAAAGYVEDLDAYTARLAAKWGA